MRIIVWLFRATLFFVLFAFALNNQQETTVKWFFGFEWRAPTVIVVLSAFALGCVFGVMGMLPSWWRHRRNARRHMPAPADQVGASTMSDEAAAERALMHPPREGHRQADQ